MRMFFKEEYFVEILFKLSDSSPYCSSDISSVVMVVKIISYAAFEYFSMA